MKECPMNERGGVNPGNKDQSKSFSHHRKLQVGELLPLLA